MPYGPITLLSDLIAGQTSPSDLEAANLLAAAQRQVKQFLGVYLGVALNDDGSLRVEAVAQAITDGQIPFVPGTDTVDTPALVDGAVTGDKLGANSVTTEKIVDGSVTTAKLAAGAVTTAKIANSAITNDQIADSTISAAKLAGGAQSAIGDGSLTAAKLALATPPTAVCLPVIGVSTATSTVCQIGGAMSATVDSGTTPPTLKFAFGSGAGGGRLTIAAVPFGVTLTGTGAHTLTTISRTLGDDNIIAFASGVFTIKTNGLFIVSMSTNFAPVGGGGTGTTARISITDNSDVEVIAGTAGSSSAVTSTLFGVISVSNAPVSYKVKAYTDGNMYAGDASATITGPSGLLIIQAL